MPIPSPAQFRLSTVPKVGPIKIKFEGTYGQNMALVLASLEAYWENQTAAVQVQEALLYNLWKQCGKWLKLKETKPEKGLFLRRKQQVQALRRETMAELVRISPRVAAALQGYGARKQHGPRQVPLKPLHGGYALERQIYVNAGKRTGYSVSQSQAHYVLGEQQSANPSFAAMQQKGFDNLTEDDAIALARLFPLDDIGGWNVAFFNKIARLKYLVSIGNDGLFYDLDGRAVSHHEQRKGKYEMAAYAMDKYGNVFVNPDIHHADYVDTSRPNPNVDTTQIFNHSSFLAGADVLCAGCIHIGYDARKQRLVPGVLSAIDNGSGHYRPSAENLSNCLRVLQEHGIDLTGVRAGDCSYDPPRFYWAHDFIGSRHGAWPSHDESGTFLKAPPVHPGI